MAVTGAPKYKTAAAAGTWTPGDMNGMQEIFGLGTAAISGAESRSNVAYATLATPDQVANVVLPANGLIGVAFNALWQESVIGAGRAAIFIGANQLKVPSTSSGAAITTQAAVGSSAAGPAIDTPLSSCPIGLLSSPNVPGPVVTTGQAVGFVNPTTSGLATQYEEGSTVRTLAGGLVLGGPCYIFAAAGTYTVSVQFRSTSGSVAVKDRKLWVWTLGA